MNRKSQLQSSIKKFESSLNLVGFEKLSRGLSKEILGFPDEVGGWPDDERKLAEKLFKDIVYKKLSVYKAYRYD